MPSLAGRAARFLKLDRRDQIAWSVRWRALFPHTGYREHQRVPLWHPDVPFVLITSQRAGSTLGTAWFFHHAGLLDQATRHGWFVHRYEQEVFLRSPGYFEGLERALAERPVLKLVRDPGARAYSSYLALHTEEAMDPRDHRSAIRRRVRRTSSAAKGPGESPLPFADFLAWLARADHRRLDGHEARQTNLYEDRLPRGRPEPVRLEEVATAIPRLEQRFGLPVSAQSQLQGFSPARHSVAKEEQSGAALDVILKGLPMPRPARVPKIDTRTIASVPEAHRSLLHAFAEDFDRFGYDRAVTEDMA